MEHESSLCIYKHQSLELTEHGIKIMLSSTQPLRTRCFSDRASWIDYILITNFDALIIIYS